MIGRFTRGMKVNIPAMFQNSQGNNVPVDNVNVSVEFYDKSTNQMIQMLPETPMKERNEGQYSFDFIIPNDAGYGNYIVRIQAKQAGSRNTIPEGSDFFEVVESSDVNNIPEDKPNNDEIKRDSDQPSFEEEAAALERSVSDQKLASIDLEGRRREVADIVKDVYNEPIQNVHINVYEKRTFVAGSRENAKVATAMTDETGSWKVILPVGEYVFVYKGIDFREERELRKVI